ncbi:MAG: DegT/DnrJ/EryC1/StrS family aminotransferase [Opitutae bacterium]|jgi:dTDP-4-amino-4,6-dideoxygalactose transaminase|nr:DegT/DnrJ/EryC1/StrS family aminotransferase [Opitutae bacterium]
MQVPFNDLHAQYQSLKEEIDAAISSVIAGSNFIRGPHIKEFENAFSKKTGTKHCISCANGTDALYISMKALGLGPGDEVITTAHSWISTSEAISQTGARVVFCDVNENDFLIDVEKIPSLITERTKGIIPVHLFGQAVEMTTLMDIARKHGLWVLEDCAQAHFATYKGKMVGTFGDAATFSFYPGKNLGAMGDAGCVATNREDVAEFAALFARHGGKGEHLIEGINSRMDGMQAAILNVKLSHIEKWTEKRRKAAKNYDKLLKCIPSITTPQENEHNDHVYHLYVIKLKERNQLKKYLQENGIQTVINYPKALPFYKAYDYLGHKHSDFPNSFTNQSKILSLPIHPEISLESQQFVIERIKAFMRSL